jgi:hypothetical protein
MFELRNSKSFHRYHILSLIFQAISGWVEIFFTPLVKDGAESLEIRVSFRRTLGS